VSDWIETFSGKKFLPQAPDPRKIDIVDIAHALSMKCRYGGHTRQFYSVAQHSVIVSTVVPEEYALEGLLHDAAEAYMPDIPRTMRTHLVGADEFENQIHLAVAHRFSLVYPYPEIVVQADDRILVDEARDLMHSCGAEWEWESWGLSGKGYGIKVKPVLPKEAHEMFVTRYASLIETRDVEDPWHFKSIMKERRTSNDKRRAKSYS